MASPDKIVSFPADRFQIAARDFRRKRIAVIRMGVMTVEPDQLDCFPVQSDAPAFHLLLP